MQRSADAKELARKRSAELALLVATAKALHKDLQVSSGETPQCGFGGASANGEYSEGIRRPNKWLFLSGIVVCDNDTLLQEAISKRYDGRPVNIMTGTGAFAK